MRALLLAAGKGTRISRYLSGNPKCTVDIGGEPLICYTLNLLKKKGITEVAMVLGYKAEVIRETVKDFEVSFYYNPFYDVTNSIASAWFAKEFLKETDDLLIMNADVFLEEGILDEIMASSLSPVLFSDETRKEEADYKFYYENNILMKYGKELTGADITGEYIGAAKLSSSFIPEFVEQLEGMITTQQHSVWWENVLYAMTDRRDIYVQNIENKFWAEVDYIEDYERILAYRKKTGNA